MIKILFLDDEKIRYDVFKTRFALTQVEIDYCATLKECHAKMQQHVDGVVYYDIIHFDHDLLEPTNNLWYSSKPLAEWFINECKILPKEKHPKMAIIHSINPSGAWELYHVFSMLIKSFVCPFRLENSSEYHIALNSL